MSSTSPSQPTVNSTAGIPPPDPAEFGQIAGRAGRHMRDGTFGTTGRCLPFDEELVEALENHRFDSVRMLQWRNTSTGFFVDARISSLRSTSCRNSRDLTRAPLAEDQMVLDIAARDEKVMREAKTRADIARLWDCCQIPDYRKLSPAAHAELALFDLRVRRARGAYSRRLVRPSYRSSRSGRWRP